MLSNASQLDNKLFPRFTAAAVDTVTTLPLRHPAGFGSKFSYALKE